MRLPEIVSESWRNLPSGTTHAASFALALGLSAGTLVAADGITIGVLHDEATAFVASGASIRVLQAEGAVDGGACDGLPGHGTIGAAGAVAAADAMTFPAVPGMAVPVFAVSPGLLQVLGGAGREAGAWVSEELASILRVEPGDVLQTDGDELVIAAVFAFPDDGRDSRLGGAILTPVANDQDFDECWAQAWPSSDSTDVLLRSTALTVDSTTAHTIGQVNNRLGTTFDGEVRFAARLTRFAPIVCVIVGGVLGWLSTRRRRLEYAAALHARQQRGAQLLASSLETCAWAVLGGAIGCGMLVLATHRLPLDIRWEVVSVAWPGLLSAISSAMLGAMIGASSSRERHLFRYFRTRT